jgi:hypothetical protein
VLNGSLAGGEWIHVYVWVRPFIVHVKLPQHLIGYTPTQNKVLKKKNSITTDFLRTSCYFQSSSKPVLEGGTTKYFKVKNI